MFPGFYLVLGHSHFCLCLLQIPRTHAAPCKQAAAEKSRCQPRSEMGGCSQDGDFSCTDLVPKNDAK